jgi:hypothetical protein
MFASRLQRVLTDLTAVKLALQMLRRRPDLCGQPNGVLQKALDATESVIREVRADVGPAAPPEQSQAATQDRP